MRAYVRHGDPSLTFDGHDDPPLQNILHDVTTDSEQAPRSILGQQPESITIEADQSSFRLCDYWKVSVLCASSDIVQCVSCGASDRLAEKPELAERAQRDTWRVPSFSVARCCWM